MNSNYKMYSDNVVDALNEVEKFKESMEGFIEKYPNYSYTVAIDPEQDPDKTHKWVVNINIKMYEHEEINVP